MLTTSYTKDNPYLGKIKKRYLLNKTGSSKKCFHLELSVDSNISYEAGDSIGILPSNDPAILQKIERHLSIPLSDTIYSSRYKTEFTLQDFLEKKANITKLTSGLFRFLLDLAPTQKKVELAHLLDPEKKALLADFLHQHELWDLLIELEIYKAPAGELCDKLLPMLPRFYSIASSHKLHPSEIHLTVAEVSFTSLGHPRYGVGTHFLCHLAKEEKTPIPLYIHPSHGFTLPLDLDAPIIMIGPGTGIAPFRAFMQERESLGAKGKNWLFFGERNQAFDYYYEDYWQKLQKNHFMKLTCAFSRDQKEKIYVQHRLKEHGKEVWNWLQNGCYLYVCGDETAMAKDVEAALQEIAKEHGNMPEEDAFSFLKKLKLEKRYLMDVY